MLLLKPLRFLVSGLTEESTPRQMALGFALGALIGLVPKGNLTAVALMGLLCAVRVNLGAGLFGLFLFSWVAILTDPLADSVGLWLLSQESLRSVWTMLYDTPVVPWTGFSNTLVLGSLILGVALFYPLYRLSEPGWNRYWPPIEQRIKKLRVVQALWGVEWTGKLGSL
jgi:uncharacterized protein (TIGR03546 family)